MFSRFALPHSALALSWQENTLLDNSKRPLVKMCDFGYSKHAKDSLPKSKVGTPGYTGAVNAMYSNGVADAILAFIMCVNNA